MEKRELVARVASASKAESVTIQHGSNCVPVAVGFTHGYSDSEFVEGLHPKTWIDGVKRGAHFVSKKHDEDLVVLEIPAGSIEKMSPDIKSQLEKNRASWVVFMGKNEGHMFGALNGGEGKQILWKPTEEITGIEEVGTDKVVEIVKDKHKQKDKSAWVFSFSKNK